MGWPFKKKDLSEQYFSRAKKYAETWRQEFDMEKAIEQYKHAVGLKPEEPRYRIALGLTYLRIPHMAMTRQIQINYRINDSVNLAIVEFNKAATFSKDYMGYPVIGYMCLGDDAKAIQALAGFKDVWSSTISEEHTSVILQVMKSSQSRIMVIQPPWDTKKIQDEAKTLNYVRLIINSEGEEGKNKFNRLMNSVTLLAEVKVARQPERNPDDAIKHLGQAIQNRDRGKHDKAERDLQNAWVLAPNLTWWYSALYKMLS
jgi:tetratricopeptide (TPR) repeat protein